MKKTIFTLALLLTVPAFSEEGLIFQFMKEQDEALKLPSSRDLFSTGVVVAGAAVAGVIGHSTIVTPQPQIRSFVAINPSISILASPYLWFTFGALTTVFSVYHFIGYEMSIIIETKSTLLGLEKQIKLWEKELPLLKENQANLTAKVKEAVEILDTITPLVVKLAKNSETTGTAQQVIAIKNELFELKNLVTALTSAQGTAISQAITKKSHSLFGFKKKQRRSDLSSLCSALALHRTL